MKKRFGNPLRVTQEDYDEVAVGVGVSVLRNARRVSLHALQAKVMEETDYSYRNALMQKTAEKMETGRLKKAPINDTIMKDVYLDALETLTDLFPQEMRIPNQKLYDALKRSDMEAFKEVLLVDLQSTRVWWHLLHDAYGSRKVRALVEKNTETITHLAASFSNLFQALFVRTLGHFKARWGEHYMNSGFDQLDALTQALYYASRNTVPQRKTADTSFLPVDRRSGKAYVWSECRNYKVLLGRPIKWDLGTQAQGEWNVFYLGRCIGVQSFVNVIAPQHAADVRMYLVPTGGIDFIKNPTLNPHVYHVSLLDDPEGEGIKQLEADSETDERWLEVAKGLIRRERGLR